MKKVLLIEDEPVLGESMVDILEMHGVEVNWVQSYALFLGTIEKDQTYDLLICDYHLPDGTLKDIHEFLQENNLGHLNLLACSATAAQHELDYLEDQGIPLLPKPFKLNELMSNIEMHAS